MTIQQPPTPECDRLLEVAPFSQKIGEFIDWLHDTKHWSIAEEATDDEDDEVSEPGRAGSIARIFSTHPHGSLDLHPARYRTEALLAEFFDIDLNKVEDERRAILAALRVDIAMDEAAKRLP